MPTTGWGFPRLATHGLVLGVLAAALLGPLQLGLQAGAGLPGSAVPGRSSDIGPVQPHAQVPASIRPDGATMHGARLTLAALPTTADLTENLHHLGRFSWPAQGVITTYFSDYHPGIDIANAEGTVELAADAGTVVFAGWGSYGLYVEIDHGNGFHTIYGHMASLSVLAGQPVSPGQRIGLMGSTGRSTGPHLHFEIRYQGAAQNPLDFLR